MSASRSAVSTCLHNLFGQHLSVDTGYICPSVILGPTINVTVCDQAVLNRCLHAFKNSMFAYHCPDDTSIQAAFPLSSNTLEHWQQARRDRQAASGVISVRNAIPLASLHNPQSFYFTLANNKSSDSTWRTLSPAAADFLENVILYLMANLLLPADHARALLLDLLENNAASQGWPLDCSMFVWRRFPPSLGIRVARALSQRLFPFPDPVIPSLRSFHHDQSLFTQSPEMRLSVEQELSSRDGILVIAFSTPPPHCHPASRGRCWAPVIPPQSGPLFHATMLHQPFAKQVGAMLLAFTKIPTESDVQNALHAIQPEGDLCLRFFTEPFRYSSMVLTTPLFRMDGQLNIRVADRILAPRVRVALALSKSTGATLDIATSSSGIVSSPQCTSCIIYVRVSRALQGDSSSSAERQFVQILTRIHELIDASSLVQLVVGVEYCSSSQQPWSARILLPHLIRGLDRFVLFSTNPDRVTRRSSELATIIAAIEQRQSEWWSLGIEGSTTIWTRVSDPSPRSPVSCQLVKSRQVALQQGLYTRAVNFETRILAVLRHQEPPQMAALQRTMARLARPYHHVLVWTRTSPTFSNPETKEDNLTSSLARQRTFLDRVLRLVQPYKLTYKDVREVSAFGNEAMRRLQTVLTELDGRTLVVAVMVDRLVRHEKHLPVLKDILTRNHSQLACILWDPQLFKTKDASDIGNDWLSNHPLPPSHELSLPILAPCIWLDVDQEQWNPNVLRHIKAAQEFCEGFRLTMFQGSSSLLIPRELLQAEGARGFSERRADAWKGHAQRFFPAAQVEVHYLNAQNAYSCGCPMDKQHREDCLCPCQYCKRLRARSCPCSVQLKCSCGIFCNCVCENCHTTPGPPAAASDPIVPSAPTEEWSSSTGNPPTTPLTLQGPRLCANAPSCLNPAPVRSQGGLLCGSCYRQSRKRQLEQTPCDRDGCSNSRVDKHKWCSIACYERSTPDPRRCSHIGCRHICPPGTGNKCNTHVHRAKKL